MFVYALMLKLLMHSFFMNESKSFWWRMNENCPWVAKRGRERKSSTILELTSTLKLWTRPNMQRLDKNALFFVMQIKWKIKDVKCSLSLQFHFLHTMRILLPSELWLIAFFRLPSLTFSSFTYFFSLCFFLFRSFAPFFSWENFAFFECCMTYRITLPNVPLYDNLILYYNCICVWSSSSRNNSSSVVPLRLICYVHLNK